MSVPCWHSKAPQDTINLVRFFAILKWKNLKDCLAVSKILSIFAPRNK